MAGRIVYLVTEDWYFASHRLPMARAAKAAGFEVHVATRVDRHGALIEAEGFRLHPLPWNRGSLNVLQAARLIREIRRLYRVIKPDLAHHVALEPSLFGSLAALGLPITCLNAITGVGTSFTGKTVKLRLARAVLRMTLRPLLNRRRAAVLVQNPDDRAMVENLGIAPQRIALIPGSGVDVRALTPKPEPSGPVVVGFVGRLLEDKGIRALIAAHETLCRRGQDIRLRIAGEPDPANPSSISPAEIAAWRSRPQLDLHGYVADIDGFWAGASIAVLPSRREGLPLSLLEAAACGRPLVATDVPGCREIARPDVNALLVPPDEPQALAEAIERLATDAALRRQFGAASRMIAEQEFSTERVGQEIVALYRRLLQGGASTS